MNRNTLSLFAMITAFLLAVAPLATPARADIAAPKEALKEISYGKAEAKVVIYGFESLSCPHCQKFHTGAWPKIKKAFVETGKVRFVLRDFPHNAQGFFGLLVARCLGPGRTRGMVDILFTNQAQWAFLGRDKFYAALGRYARLGGMNDKDFQACLRNKPIIEGIQKSLKEATEKFKVKSVPTFLIGTQKQIDNGEGKRVDGAQPFEIFEKVISEALAAAGKN